MAHAKDTEAMNKHIPYLDGWRGLAILCVLIAHFCPIPEFEMGRLGVDLFFVLSGLLMSQILYERRTPLKNFYYRRFSRIVPVFVLFVLIIFIIAPYTGKTFSIPEALSTLAFTRTYWPSHPGIWETQLPIGHIWSLNVEEHSYIFLSLLTLIPLTKFREGWTLLVTAALTILITKLYPHFASIPDFELRTECAATALLASAGYRTFVKNKLYRLPWYLRKLLFHPVTPIIAFIVGVACYSRHAPEMAGLLIAPFALAYCVNHLNYTYTRLLEMRWLQLLGIWSFSLYIWQQPFYKMQGLIPTWTALALAMLCGLASFYLYESPIRNWLNNRRK